MKKFDEMLFPYNLGATKGGTDVGICADKVVTRALKANPDLMHVQIDYKNAFNLLHRKWMREVFAARCPELLPYFDLVYEKHGTIFYSKDVVIKSQRGFHQGDGLAGFGFPLSLVHKFQQSGLDKKALAQMTRFLKQKTPSRQESSSQHMI